MKFILKNVKISVLALIISFGFTACDEEDDFQFDDDDLVVVPTPTPDPDPTDDGSSETNTIVDFADANGFSSLVAAVEAAGLTATLSGDTEYTVFAPTDDAFATFLTDNGFASLDEVPEATLELILLNHVQPGRILSTDLTTGYIASTAAAGPDGENVSMFINTDGGVTINGVSTVTSADNEVDNGIVHAVDAVIGLPDVTTFALADPTFSILVQALTREDSYTFVDILQSTDDNTPFTVFAPTDDAFVALLAELEVDELGDIDADVLADVLSYHVLTEINATSGDLTDGMTVTTFQGEDLTINVGDNVTITDVNGRVSTVVLADVQATNGVIHAIDMVLLPTLD